MEEKTKAKIRAYQLGRKKKPESIAKTALAKIKKWHECGYVGKHKKLYKQYGKAIKCENPSCPQKCLYYEWANISGKYRENRSDWMMLCCSCHKLYDLHGGIL